MTEPSGIPRELEEDDWLIVHLHGVEKGREAERAAIVAWLREALREYVYETTHLSPQEEDGSHWCKISANCLNTVRAALTGSE